MKILQWVCVAILFGSFAAAQDWQPTGEYGCGRTDEIMLGFCDNGTCSDQFPFAGFIRGGSEFYEQRRPYCCGVAQPVYYWAAIGSCGFAKYSKSEQLMLAALTTEFDIVLPVCGEVYLRPSETIVKQSQRLL